MHFSPSKAPRSFRGRALRFLLFSLIPAGCVGFLVFGGAGCGGGGGGGGGGSSLQVIGVRAQSGPRLPWNDFYTNERILLEFSSPLDPTTIDLDSIQIRSVASSFTRPVEGDFVVRGRVVSFVPALPSGVNALDGGFAPGARYRVFLPAFPDGRALRSTAGEPLARSYQEFFEIRQSEPFATDHTPGPPRIVSVAFDFDGDGEVDADGNPETENREELEDFHRGPPSSPVPVGLARAPSRIVVFVSEPLLVDSVLSDFDDDFLPDRLLLRDLDHAVDLPIRVEVVQEFVAEEDRYRAAIVIDPMTTLPPGSRLELRLSSGILDYGSPPSFLDLLTLPFVTEQPTGSFEDAIVETFEDDRRFSGETTAEWNLEQSGALASGGSLGGSGVDGMLFVPDRRRVDLDTDRPEGPFQFTEVYVSPRGRIKVTGKAPLRLFCEGDMTIEGELLLEGEPGNTGVTDSNAPVPGGSGGPGGFAGGDSNNPPPRAQRGGRGQAPPGFPLAGGEGGGVSPSGGGGGGGHTFFGGVDIGENGGEGGSPYGDPEIPSLIGGAGGGAGGNHVTGQDRQVTAGSGGGGGGAGLLSCGGTFRISGRISANGGAGGLGGRPVAGSIFGSSGGGGGAGGAIKLRARRIDSAVANRSFIVARGGPRGNGVGFGSRNGGIGSSGRIVIEVFDEDGDGTPNEVNLDTTQLTVAPDPLVRGFRRVRSRESRGQSVFIDTGVEHPFYSFAGTDPKTGKVIRGLPRSDLRLRDPGPLNSDVSVFFEGAPEDPGRPGMPDLSRATGFSPRIEDSNGYRFVRFRVDFDLGPDFEDRDPITIEEIAIRFRFDL